MCCTVSSEGAWTKDCDMEIVLRTVLCSYYYVSLIDNVWQHIIDYVINCYVHLIDYYYYVVTIMYM